MFGETAMFIAAYLAVKATPVIKLNWWIFKSDPAISDIPDTCESDTVYLITLLGKPHPRLRNHGYHEKLGKGGGGGGGF